MVIRHEHCTPYLSATLFHADSSDTALVGKLRRAISAALRNQTDNSNRANSPDRTFSAPRDSEFSEDGLNVTWFHYAERRQPPWYAENDLKDTNHQFVIICQKGSFVSLSFSDPSARNFVIREIARAEEAPLNKLTRFSPAEINTAYIEHGVRTLWLSGAHRRMPIKPDAKILSGLDLESALDPLEDQSYYFSSIRSTSTNRSLDTKNSAAVIGANPRNARIWIGPTSSWDDFSSRMGLILDQAAEKTAGEISDEPPIEILAQPSRGIAGIEQPYDMAVIVPELSLAEIANVADDERWFQQFSDAARFDVKPVDGSPSFEADIFWGDEELGSLAYNFEERENGNVHISVETRRWSDDAEYHQELLKICKNSDFLTIYFDTGHTYSRGMFYKTHFRDAHFNDWRWVKMPSAKIDVRKEKPLDGLRFAVENIGNDADRSLFGMVARHWPDLEGSGVATGWLVCDDGAMESADFIHFDDSVTPPALALIHVKGSHSESLDRGISVSDYEVVVGQAVKNLRHMDRGLLFEKLNANKSGILKDAVWHNGQRQQDREGVLQALESAGSNMDKTVVVLQPRVRRSIYDNIRARMNGGEAPNAEIRRMQQLDALLLGARADCIGLGARFVVIADDDGQ